MAFSSSGSPNILVVRLSSLGDVALTVPVYRSLKAHWPGCRITVLTKPSFTSVLQGHPAVDEVLPFTGLLDALAEIRERRFTHLLDLHGNLRSRLIRWLSGIPAQAAYRKDALARRLFVAFGWSSPALTRHTLDRYLAALSAWGVRPAGRALVLGDARAAPLARAPKRVLVLQTAFLGDATLTIPLARGVKAAFPDCRLTLVTRPDCAELFRASPWVDETWTDDKRAWGSFKALVRRLQAGAFDLALVPHRSLRSALAVRLAGVPERVGFSTSVGGRLFTRTIPFTWGMHDLERNLSLLLPLAPALDAKGAAGEPVYLEPAPEARAKVAARLADAGIREGDRLIGLHPGSVWATKRWPWERFAELARRLRDEEGARLVLVGGPGDRDLCRQVAEAAGEGVLDWAGATSLAELIALMPRLALLATNDSGPMHIATASGVPTLAFFGPTTRELGFFPYGSQHRVLEAELGCRPCGLHGARKCPHGHFLCMKLLTVPEAFEHARSMLRARSLPPERAAA
ncbi:MAG: hypothetical protein HY553_23315 [Elusimicrobia bacterium]|nr:hypothetical protein [Elusimicrobiota bacterium]